MTNDRRLSTVDLQLEMLIQNKNSISAFIERHPVWSLIIIAGIFRLLAVIFAKGYMAGDDHFLVIHIADGWLKGVNHWAVNNLPIRGILYPYAVTALMWFLKQITITDPNTVMYFVRFSHGLWSLLTIPLIYYAVEKHSDRKTAFIAGLLGALFFLNPFMSVRNLPEFVCQPVILAGLILADAALRKKDAEARKLFILSGLLLGFGFVIRYQNSVIPLAVFVYLLLRKRWLGSLLFALGVASMIGLELALDFLSYKPFQIPFLNLLIFQSGNVHSYVTNPFYAHLGTILLAFIPPFSFIFIWWVIRGAKKMPATFWGMLFFLFIHSLIPQKQERFILPLLPPLIVLGMIGAYGSKIAAKKWMKYLWGWFWAVNTILLLITTFNYSQKARVESLIRLGRNPEVRAIVVINTEHPLNPPTFYLGREMEMHVIHRWSELESLKQNLTVRESEPLYFVIFAHKPLNYYLENLQPYYPGLQPVDHVSPSLVDALLHFMNPKYNHSKEAYIYRWQP